MRRRVAILQKKARMRRSDATGRRTLLHCFQRSKTTRRELEGAITKIRGWRCFRKAGSIWDAWPRRHWGDNAIPDQRRITIQNILDAVTKYYNVRLSDLQSKKRHKSIAFPRQVCMYLARRHTRYSLEEIGGYFGGRDHTTVLHAFRTVDSDIKSDTEVAEQLTYLEAQLVN